MSMRWVVCIAMVLMASCARSQWDSGYVGARPASPPPKSAGPVVIRSVGWDRIDSTLTALDKEAAAGDVSPDDWPPERKAEAHATLLRGLQVQQDPRRVEMLGRSEFATTDDVRPDRDRGRAALEKFAERIGADTVVWSSRPLGTTDIIEQRPLTTYGSEQAWFQDRAGRWRSSQYTRSETTWVPMHTQADNFAYIAFFMRMKE